MALRLIDTHAHLDFVEYASDRNEVIGRAFNTGIEKIINIGADYAHFKSTLELSFAYDNIYAVVGLHPQEAVSLLAQSSDIDREVKQIQQRIESFSDYKTMVGIGEIGLDFFHIARESSAMQPSITNLQHRLFEAQVETALKVDLPIVIHARDAYGEILEVLSRYAGRGNLRGVVHSFEGDFETAMKFIQLGIKISFNGIITYERTHDELAAIKEIPLTEIMLETDCPYLTPEPLRGQRNEPSNVEYIARKVAALRGISAEAVAGQTTENAIKLFNLG
ncbi:MAG: TatD family hydrolase [Patescibacteria group bacterium]